MVRRIIAAVLAALVLAGGWYVGSPWWTLWRMREAALAQDARRLARHMDLQAISAQAEAACRNAWESVPDMVRSDTPNGAHFIGLAKRKLAECGTYVTRPQDFQGWLADQPVRWGGLEGFIATDDFDPFIERHALDGFEVRYRGVSREYGPLLTFRRDGLGWKLVAVRWGQQ